MGSKARILPLEVALPRNLAFVCFSRSFGGLEMTTVRIARLLADRGANVHLVVPDGSPMHAECLSQSLSHSTLEPSVKYGDLRASWRLGRIFSRYAIDAAFFFRSQDIHLGTLAKGLHPPTHLIFYQQMQSGIRKKDVFHDAVFSQLSAWLTLTDIMRKEVVTWTNMAAEKVHVAYLGRDEHMFAPSSTLRTEARREMKIPPTAFVAGVLGRLDRQKGQIEFLKSFPTVRDALRRTVFLIAGDETKNDPGMKAELQGLAETLDQRGQIRIIPPTDNVQRFMAALDVFVMPSYSETYGLVLLEAMAMGLPIVTTNSGGVPELVRHGSEGLLVEPKDVGSLSEAIIRLGSDRTFRRTLGDNGRRRFLDNFREEHCIDHLVEILRNILH